MSGAGENEARAARDAAGERADVLAYLLRRRANVEAVLGGQWEAEAKAIARHLDIIADHIAAGLHEGEAAVAAARAHHEQQDQGGER